MLKALRIEMESAEFQSLPPEQQWLVQAMHQTYQAWRNVQDALADASNLSDELQMQTMRAALSLWDAMKALDATITALRKA